MNVFAREAPQMVANFFELHWTWLSCADIIQHFSIVWRKFRLKEPSRFCTQFYSGKVVEFVLVPVFFFYQMPRKNLFNRARWRLKITVSMGYLIFYLFTHQGFILDSSAKHIFNASHFKDWYSSDQTWSLPLPGFS